MILHTRPICHKGSIKLRNHFILLKHMIKVGPQPIIMVSVSDIDKLCMYHNLFFILFFITKLAGPKAGICYLEVLLSYVAMYLNLIFL